MPAAAQAARSSITALAVIATMYGCSRAGTQARIRTVAGSPSRLGLCMSTRTRS